MEIRIVLLICIIVLLVSMRGWIIIWNSIIVAIMVIILNYIGTVEGLLIVVLLVLLGQLFIRKNNKARKCYSKFQTKFVEWCNRNIFEIKNSKSSF